MPSSYTQDAPTSVGTTVSVDVFLRNSPLVQRSLQAMAYNRWIADYVFRPGQRTASGSVMYQQLLENDLFTSRDVQEIEELSEFPILNSAERGFEVATVKKWGGAVLFSYEKQRRDVRDLLARDLTRLRNTTVRKMNRLAVAVFNANANVQTLAATAVWSDGTNRSIRTDIETAKNMIDALDMGYMADTALVNPDNKLEMLLDNSIVDRLPKENTAQNPLLEGDMSGLFGLEWIATSDVPHGTVYVVNRGMVGSVHDEVPFYSRVVDWPQREGTLLQAARIAVPVITDPKAAVKISGV